MTESNLPPGYQESQNPLPEFKGQCPHCHRGKLELCYRSLGNHKFEQVMGCDECPYYAKVHVLPITEKGA